MVPSSVIIALQINCVVCFALPVSLAILLFWKGRRSVIFPLLIGAVTFIVAQFILRIPFLNLLNQTEWMSALNKSAWFTVILSGVTAGVFEEFVRYGGLRILRYRHSWSDGAAFGVGFAGAEAILLTALSNMGMLTLCKMANTGEYEGYMRRLGRTEEEITEGLQSLTALVPAEVLMAGVERVCTMAIQIGLTLLVLYALREHKFRFVWLAVALHMVFDISIGLFASVAEWSVFAVEAAIAIFAVAAVWLTLRLRKLMTPIDPQSTMAFVKLPDQPNPLTAEPQFLAAQKPDMPDTLWGPDISHKGKSPKDKRS